MAAVFHTAAGLGPCTNVRLSLTPSWGFPALQTFVKVHRRLRQQEQATADQDEIASGGKVLQDVEKGSRQPDDSAKMETKSRTRISVAVSKYKSQMNALTIKVEINTD